ncbi:MAG: hypothetical protein KC547_14785 [Anaerolineae bacterium]|nr:hypothetical protein [Anaerolineae bacterium]
MNTNDTIAMLESAARPIVTDEALAGMTDEETVHTMTRGRLRSDNKLQDAALAGLAALGHEPTADELNTILAAAFKRAANR